MIAFVLSGGGPRGALQAGALQVLLEQGVRPDMLIGTSAGALNAAYLAADPTLPGAGRLTDIWRGMRKDEIYHGGMLQGLWHVLTHRDSIYCNDRMRAFLETHTPASARRFRNVAVRLYIVATDLFSGQPYIFGDDPDEPVLDALMASTAMPPALPPWKYRGRLYVDGAVAADLPLNVALERGATEIYALDTPGDASQRGQRPNIWDVASWSVASLIHQQRAHAVAICRSYPGVRLHHLLLATRERVAFDDFAKASTLIDEGRNAAAAYLESRRVAAAEQPRPQAGGWQHNLRLARERSVDLLLRRVRRVARRQPEHGTST